MQNKHTIIYFLGRGLPGLVSFLAVTIYTRLILPDEYGRYALVMATVSLVNMVLYQWIRLSLLRHLPKSKSAQEQGLLYSSIALGFIISSLLSAILALIYCICYHPSYEFTLLIKLGFVLLILEAFFELNLEYFRSNLRPVKYSFAFIVKALTAVSCGTILAFYHFGAVGLICGIITADLLVMIIFFGEFIKQIFTQIKHFDKNHYKKMLLYGLPLTASFAMIFIINSSDRYFIDYYIGQSATGMYSVGYDFSNNSLSVIMNSINLASFPLAIRALENGGKPAADKQLELNFVLLTSIAIPVAFAMVCLSDRISGVFIGKHYVTETIKIIPYISIAALIAGIKNYYFDISFQLGNKTYLQIWSVAAAALTNVVLNIIWIPRIGVIGAVYSTVIAYVVALLMSYIFSKKSYVLPLPWLKTFKIVLAATIMAGFITFIKDFCAKGIFGLGLIAVSGIILYCFLLYLFNILKMSKQIFRKN